MLQAIRDKAQGWIAWVIVVLITIPFALWGIQEYLGVSSDPVVVTVEGNEITERDVANRIRNVRENMRISLGKAYRADLFDEATLRQQVIDRMISESVLSAAEDSWNMRASDAQVRGYITAIGAFQRDGKFDNATYESVLRNQGLNPVNFEQTIRRDVITAQMESGVKNSLFVTDSEIADRVRLQEETRLVSYLKIPASDYIEGVTFSDEELNAAYQRYQVDFQIPERVKLAYLMLDIDSLTQQIEYQESDLIEYFEQNEADFVVPEERKISHILINAPANAEPEIESAALAKATDLLEKIKNGEDFSVIAKDNSDDTGSAELGGELGWVATGIMVQPFEDAAFALNKGELSNLVRSEFGFHIITVTDIRGGGQAGFTDVRMDVEERFRRREAENLYYDYAERLADSAYESPNSLEPAADALGLSIQTTDWVDLNTSLPGDLSEPKVINSAFSDDVLQGNNSDMIEIGTEKAVVLRVTEHEEATVKSFADVKDAVRTKLAAETASDSAAKEGKGVQEKLATSGRLDEVAKSSWQVNDAVAVNRKDRSLPAEVIAEAFSVSPPSSGETKYVGTVSADGDYFVVGVSDAVQGDVSSLDEAGLAALKQRVLSVKGTTYIDALTQSLLIKADVER